MPKKKESLGKEDGKRHFSDKLRRRRRTHKDRYPGDVTFKGGLIRYKVERDSISRDRTDLDTFDLKGERWTEIFGRLLLYGKRMLPILGLRDLKSTSCWRAALVELVGNCQFTFLSCGSVVAAITFQYDPPSQAIAIINIPLLAFFIFAMAAASGGHLNPLITFATVLTRLCTVVRGVLYIIAQMIGAILGCLLLRAVIGEDVATQTVLGGCVIGTQMGEGRAYLSEVIFSFGQLFIAFGTVLDPRQSQIFGPIVAPFFVSITVAVFIFISSSMFVGYSGAGMNPSRCMAPSIALGDNLHHIWIYAVGPITAALILAVLYNLLPPHHKTVYKEYREKRKANREERKAQRLKQQQRKEEGDDQDSEQQRTDADEEATGQTEAEDTNASEIDDDENGTEMEAKGEK